MKIISSQRDFKTSSHDIMAVFCTVYMPHRK